MKRHWIAAAAAGVLALSAGVARAGNVYWSIGIQAPPVATVISNAPAYHYQSAPVYVAPQPVYVAPQPVYVAPPPVVYRSAPAVVYQPQVVYPPQVVYRSGHHHRGRHWHRDEYGTPYHGGHWGGPRGERYRHH